MAQVSEKRPLLEALRTPYMKRQIKQAAQAFVAGIFLMYILLSVVFTLLRMAA